MDYVGAPEGSNEDPTRLRGAARFTTTDKHGDVMIRHDQVKHVGEILLKAKLDIR